MSDFNPCQLNRQEEQLSWPPSDDERDILNLVINDHNAAIEAFETSPVEESAFPNDTARRIFAACRLVWHDLKSHGPLEPSTLASYFKASAAKCQAQADGEASGPKCIQLEQECAQWLNLSQIVESELSNSGAIRHARKEAQAIIKRLKAAPPPFEFTTDDVLDGRLKDIEWLWHDFIPRGFVTLLVGDQDQGKSTVAQDFCRTLLIGGRWPNGETCEPYQGKLLWIDTEGALALFHQRLKSWKMPRGRFILQSDPLRELAIDSASDWIWTEAAIEKFNPPLIVLDSLSGGHTGEENSNDFMKVVLKRLSELAQRRGVAVLVVHHLNKAQTGVPDYPVTLNRIRGAGAISQFCRSVLALTTPDKSQPEQRRLDVIKLNLAKKPEAVGYDLTDHGPSWGAAPEPMQPPRAADKAVEFLRTALCGKLRPSDEVWNEAKAQGIGANAFADAKRVLKVKAEKEKTAKGRWFLSLDYHGDDLKSDGAS